MDEAIGDLAGATLCFLLLKNVDQLDGGEEPDPLVMMLDGLDANRGCDMRLARAGTADQNDIIGIVEEVAAMKLLHERLVDLAAGEVEAVQIAVGREACRLELICGRSDLSFGRFRLEKLGQDRNGSLERRRSLLGQVTDGGEVREAGEVPVSTSAAWSEDGRLAYVAVGDGRLFVTEPGAGATPVALPVDAGLAQPVGWTGGRVVVVVNATDAEEANRVLLVDPATQTVEEGFTYGWDEPYPFASTEGTGAL